MNDFVARQLSLIEKERKCEIDEVCCAVTKSSIDRLDFMFYCDPTESSIDLNL